MRNFSRMWTFVMVLSLALCGVAALGTAPALAEEAVSAPEEERPAVVLTADFLSQYIWRGYAASKESAVIQPSVTVSYKGFAVNLWGNFDTHEAAGFGEGVDDANWNETDFTFSYTHELYPNLNGTIGTIYYSLVGLDMWELYAGLSYATPWVTLAVTGYREVSHYPGWWVQFDLSRNFALPWYGMSVDLGATFLYQNSERRAAFFDPDNPNKAYDAWHTGQILAALNIPVGKYVTISPRVGYSFPLSGEASRALESNTGWNWDGEDDHIFGGVRISAAF